MIVCSPQLGVSPASNLGGEVYDREVLKGLAGLGVVIEMPLPRGACCESVPGWCIHRSPRHWRYYYEYNWLFLPHVVGAWRERAFDLLRIHSPTIAPLGWLAARATGRPAVAHYHHLEGDRLLDLISRIVIRSYSLVTTDSHFCKEQLISAYGLAGDRIEVVHPGTDAKYRPHPRNRALVRSWSLEDRCVCLYLGALAPRKNLRFLIDAFAIAHSQEHRLLLLLAGTGPQEQKLKAYVADRCLQRAVAFAGYVPEHEKVDYYNLADLFVFPSLMEGFGMAVAEAMACGVPVVCSGAASLPEVVGQAGLLASPTVKEEFCEQVLRLARDEPLRRQLGQEGLMRVRTSFSWDKASRLTQACYERVCGANGARQRDL